MPRIEKRINVDNSTERVFSYVPETIALPEIWPGLLEVGEVQHLPTGGAIAHWIYKLTGAIVQDPDEHMEPLVDRAHSLAVPGDIACMMKWSFQLNTRGSRITLDGDHTYWSMC